MHVHKAVLIVLIVACASSEPAEEAAPTTAAVSLDEFRQLQWIAGTWRGSGGAYPAFYEEYRFIGKSADEWKPTVYVMRRVQRSP